jgi:ABC-type phosphate transport system substrate-binding protein
MIFINLKYVAFSALVLLPAVLMPRPVAAAEEKPNVTPADSEKFNATFAKMTNPDVVISNSLGDWNFLRTAAMTGAGERVLLIERQPRELAMKNYLASKSAILLLSGELSASERQALAGSIVQPIAIEPLLFLVNADNKITDLSSDALRKIFSGEIVTWKPFGISDYMIHLFGTGQGSAGFDVLNDKIMKNSKLSVKIFQVTTTEEAMILTGSNQHAISYCGFTEKIPENVKMLSVDGIIPEEKNIINGKYKMVNVFYVCYGKNNVNAVVNWFVERLWSPDTGNSMKKAGLIPVVPPPTVRNN